MTDVPRETSASEPDAAQARYGQVPGLARFAEILATTGVERGLIGPREVPRLWPRHLANCAVVAEEARTEIPEGASVADVGSGAGLPGLVWALVRPDLHVTLIEPLLRRTTFLTEVVDELALSDRVEVRRHRAEGTGDRYDVVTARAVARMPQLAEWTLPLTKVGGWVVAFKGAGAAAELEEASARISALGGGPARIREFGADVLDEPTTAVLIPRVSLGSDAERDRRMGRS